MLSLRPVYGLARWVGVGVVCLIGSGHAFAQHTPVAGATSGAIGSTYASTAEDVLRRLADEQLVDLHGRTIPNAAAERSLNIGGWIIGGFTMGRLRHTEHDGYTTDGFGGTSLAFDSNEVSGVGFLTASRKGFQPNSRLTLGAYAGYSDLKIDFKPNRAIFGDLDSTGSASNGAALYGVSLGYGVDTTYTTLTAAAFSGRAKIDDVQNNFRPEFDTDGFIVSALIGRFFDIGKVGGHSSFVTVEGSAKHVDFVSGDYLSQTGQSLFDMNYVQSTANVALGFFQVHQVGQSVYRPYVRATLGRDFRYVNQSRIRGLDGTDPGTTSYDEASVQAMIEGGLIVKSGDWAVSGSGYFQQSKDADITGGRVGATYNFAVE